STLSGQVAALDETTGQGSGRLAAAVRDTAACRHAEGGGGAVAPETVAADGHQDRNDRNAVSTTTARPRSVDQQIGHRRQRQNHAAIARPFLIPIPDSPMRRSSSFVRIRKSTPSLLPYVSATPFWAVKVFSRGSDREYLG